MKSDTPRSLRRRALKCRLTWSIGHSAYSSDVAAASTCHCALLATPSHASVARPCSAPTGYLCGSSAARPYGPIDLPVGEPPALNGAIQTLVTPKTCTAQCAARLVAASKTTGPSATPGRWPRPRNHHRGDQSRPSPFQPTFELRMRENTQ